MPPSQTRDFYFKDMNKWHKRGEFIFEAHPNGDMNVAMIPSSAPNSTQNCALILAAPELLEALQSIIEIGKRDLSNPKYDSYFEFAKAVIAKATNTDTL